MLGFVLFNLFLSSLQLSEEGKGIGELVFGRVLVRCFHYFEILGDWKSEKKDRVLAQVTSSLTARSVPTLWCIIPYTYVLEKSNMRNSFT